MSGDLAAVKRLLRQPGVDVNEEVGISNPIHLGVTSKNVEVVRELLQAGADPNLPRRIPPLHSAGALGCLEIMDLPIAAGADLNATMSYVFEKTTAMAFALHMNPFAMEAVRKLIAAGADVNAGEGAFPLSLATAVINVEGVKMLLKAGANPAQPGGGSLMMQGLVRDAQEGQRHKPNSPGTPDAWDAVAALVAAGNRCWGTLSARCPRLERALPAVWATSPGDLPQLFRRLEPDAKDRIRCIWLLLRTRLREKPLCMKVLAAALAEGREAVPLEDWLPDDTIITRMGQLSI